MHLQVSRGVGLHSRKCSSYSCLCGEALGPNQIGSAGVTRECGCSLKKEKKGKCWFPATWFVFVSLLSLRFLPFLSKLREDGERIYGYEAWLSVRKAYFFLHAGAFQKPVQKPLVKTSQKEMQIDSFKKRDAFCFGKKAARLFELRVGSIRPRTDFKKK